MVSDVFSSKLTHGTWHVLVQLERGYPIGFSGSGFCPISRPAFGILKQNRTEIWDLKTGVQPWVKIWVGWRDWRTSLGTDGKHAWVGRYNTNNTSWSKELPSVKKTSFVTLVVRIIDDDNNNNWWLIITLSRSAFFEPIILFLIQWQAVTIQSILAEVFNLDYVKLNQSVWSGLFCFVLVFVLFFCFFCSRVRWWYLSQVCLHARR